MVTVISACRNEARHIREFLDSLLQQEPLAEGWEIILADGMSTDGTASVIEEYARDHQEIRLIPNPGKFVASGLNAAIRAAQGRIVIRMDAHTIYAPDYVQKCVETLERTGADNVGGAARTHTIGRLHRAIAAAYHSRFGSGGASFHDASFEGWADTVTYGCWRRETLERLGMFDETLVRNQDDELNLRLIRSGGRIWQSASIVSWYTPRSSLGALARQYFQYGFWKVAVIRKHRLPARWTHLVPGMLVLAQLGLPLLAALAWSFGWTPWVAFALGTWLFLNAAYWGAALLASMLAASASGWDLLPLLPLTFATYHFSYGLGFLCGLGTFGSPSIGRPGRLVTDLTR
jgi:glycosyltransferase involved in cell wall biosynthesis